MQVKDTTEFNNTSEWQVVHDPDTQMYTLRSAKGHKLNGVYTHRKFAELALYAYLKKIQEKKRTPKE